MTKDTLDINDTNYIIKTDEIEYFQAEFKKECEKLGLKKSIKS